MILPIHCQPPMPNWGLTKKEYIPTEEEIVQKFTQDERCRVAYTSSLLVRLLRLYVNELMNNLKYPKNPDYKRHSRELAKLEKELQKDADKAHHPNSLAWLRDCWDKMMAECETDMLKFNYATSSALLSQKGSTTPSALSTCKALFTISRIFKHGEYITEVVAQRSGMESHKFQPNPIVLLVQALLMDMADKMDCRIEPTNNMQLGMDILINKYLKILNV